MELCIDDVCNTFTPVVGEPTERWDPASATLRALDAQRTNFHGTVILDERTGSTRLTLRMHDTEGELVLDASGTVEWEAYEHGCHQRARNETL